MSWNFSPVLVAAFLEECCSGTDQSAPLNTTPTPDQFYWPDKPTEHSRLSRFGITCAPLKGVHGEELLTWYREAFLARTSASPEMELESTAQEADSGERWPGSLAKYDRATCSWKTAQRSLLGDLEPCSVTWPRSGLMLDGQCWELPTLAPRTSGSGSGLWQTPVADDAANRAAGKWNSRGEPKLSAQVMWPTPLSSNSTGAGHGPNKKGGPNLQTAVAMWPTPTVCGNHNRKGASKTSGDGLATVVAQRTWPTAHKGWSPNHKRANTDDRLDYSVEREAFQPGQQTPPMRLSPDWVELLMGWPKGWTRLSPLE